jgi:protein SCO1/2
MNALAHIAALGRRRAIGLLTGLALSGAVAAPASAQVLQSELPEEMQGVDVEEKRGDALPLDLTFTDARGETVLLGDLFDGELPVVLVLGYYDCPLLCDLVFNKTLTAFKELNLTLGKDYRAVTISFDHTNTTADAAGKQAAMLAGYDGEEGERPWSFLTASAGNARAIADAVGYTYKYLPETGEFSHPAAIVIVSPEGVVSNYLYGVEFPERQMRLALLDAADGRIGGVFDKILLFCYHYDPDAGSYALMGRRVMTIGAIATAVALAGLIGGLFLWERCKRRGDADGRSPAQAGAAPAH